MKRLYFLVPDLELTRRIVSELIGAEIAEANIYIVGRDHHALEEAHLHEAGVWRSSDFAEAMKRGVVTGGSMGLLAGLVAVSFPPLGLVLGGGAVLGLTACGAGFGAWTGSMIGAGIPERGIRDFSEAIDAGQLLMLVDVARSRKDDIVSLISSLHTDVVIEDVDLPQDHLVKHADAA